VRFESVKKLEEARDIGRALSPEAEQRLIEAATRNHSPVLHPAVRIVGKTKPGAARGA
jgi:hypothetical protein